MIGQFLVNTVLSLTDTEQCVKSVKLTLENCFIHQFSDSIGWVPKYDYPPKAIFASARLVPEQSFKSVLD